jgi:hypothetical protein
MWLIKEMNIEVKGTLNKTNQKCDYLIKGYEVNVLINITKQPCDSFKNR